MKFNWGTGIFIFLVIFLLACTAFIIFAMKQGVNLVHKDYYEKGVNYTEQMHVTARSKPFYNRVKTSLQNEFFSIDFDGALASKIDSGNVIMFRPSDSRQDVAVPLLISENSVKIAKGNLIPGRYILKIYWYSEGLKYEIDKPVNIQ